MASRSILYARVILPAKVVNVVLSALGNRKRFRQRLKYHRVYKYGLVRSKAEISDSPLTSLLVNTTQTHPFTETRLRPARDARFC